MGCGKGSPPSHHGGEQRGLRAAVEFSPSGGHRRCQLFPHHKVTPEVSELPISPPQPRLLAPRPCWSRRDARSRSRGWCCTCCWGSASAASSAPCSWAGLTCAGRETGCPARPALGPATAGRTLPKVGAGGAGRARGDGLGLKAEPVLTGEGEKATTMSVRLAPVPDSPPQPFSHSLQSPSTSPVSIQTLREQTSVPEKPSFSSAARRASQVLV